MRIGICVVELHLPGITSLKGKRSVVQSVKERVKNRFNVSVAEIDSLDLRQRASLGIAMVGNDSRKLNSELDKIVDYIEGMHVADLIHHQIEMI
ncbi:MAG: DUF503 domain-containing protein [Nitrospirae bacterium CG_4_9_14_3_um_filter_53_35]|nr:MAG: hypothetical protein AUK29_07520 [Nitrospirae bacterium CG2_30_53_67]PIS38051.1 MAG: DUF503 domain-containing protein [Nitrospirae bacterium CG08_land_8_20_14_0_20_52_24]PIV83159.1 MAG: DUF503 domain-containing protein [Nitrospirae bacterium CG17_big_fil_post_rev_8_21_14_2_50_50_9]PIW85268.1 MAG: DUF503 domain-containing protein [Nitrospirae bacterium CG_4_8_14_3_um_filter_50_41]PIX86543.1 MAG: DUF503 domain-containing protein [Nitrospirae bacterium CG_4_10_14_3_um_filter_53_41]PJA7664